MTKWLMKPFLTIELLLFFLKELILSNVQVAIYAVSPVRRLKPAIIRLPLEIRSDAEILLLANMITLTPGTLTLDVSSDRRSLFVHVIHTASPDETIASIKAGFEARIKRLFV